MKYKIKKRVILAIVLTIINIFILNKYWLIFKPMHVSLNIQGQGKCYVDVFLNKKDDDKFIKVKRARELINFGEDNHIDFYVNRSKFPKRIKFNISDVHTDTKIIISDIKIGSFEIKNLEKFEILGAKNYVKGDSLILIPKNHEISLVYPETLKVRTSIKFDFKVFIIILVLTYLLAYKLTNYIADFKTVLRKSRIDIIFLTVFFVFLFIPMSRINHDEISQVENRTLAKWYPLIKENNEINFDFGKNFNEWFSDRFAYRINFIELNRLIKLKLITNIYSESPRYFNKKNHWAFNSEWTANYVTKDFDFSEYLNQIIKLKNFCNKNNIKLYILIAPPTSEVYEEEFKATTNIKAINNIGEDFSNYAKMRNFNIIVSPLNELKSAKTEFPYTKGDVHWNEYGGYIAYQKLMKRIKCDFPNLKILKDSDFNISKTVYSKTDYNNYPSNGNIYRELNISDKYLDTEYNHYQYKKTENINRILLDMPDEKAFNIASNNPQTIYIIGNSYEECLADFLIPSFKSTVKRRYNTKGNGKLQISRFRKDIIANKPDILVVVLLSHRIDDLKDLLME